MDVAERIDVELVRSVDEWFEEGDALFAWRGPSWGMNSDKIERAKSEIPAIRPAHLRYTDAPFQVEPVTVKDRSGSPIKETLTATAPATGMVVDIAEPPAYREDGDILLMRLERPLGDFERRNFEHQVFSEIIQYLEEHGAAQADIDRMVKELNARYRTDWEAAWKAKRADDAAKAKAEQDERERKEQQKPLKQRGVQPRNGWLNVLSMSRFSEELI
ncbi:hypothetical protein V8J82_23200 [Gymnodinialimonas sp. 2305UL16-5]|uniref:hypothetical protein n=1 Tax=Gymnodinialimonas mytili TaxID=3126503 RepID=UPI0030A3E6A2